MFLNNTISVPDGYGLTPFITVGIVLLLLVAAIVVIMILIFRK